MFFDKIHFWTAMVSCYAKIAHTISQKRRRVWNWYVLPFWYYVSCPFSPSADSLDPDLRFIPRERRHERHLVILQVKQKRRVAIRKQFILKKILNFFRATKDLFLGLTKRNKTSA